MNPGTPTPAAEGAAASAEPERDTRMTSTYVQVLVLEAIIVFALWIFGRLFS